MSTVIILCEVMQEEVARIMEKHNLKYPVIYMDSRLHVNTDKLREELQKVIDYISYADRIILCFGRCGNGIIGLHSETSELQFLHTDDCISLMTNNSPVIEDMRNDTYFLSEGWITNKSGIILEYSRCIEKYGESITKEIFSNMLKNYTDLCYINTGLECKYNDIINNISEVLNLKLKYMDSDMSLLEKLILGIEDKNIISISDGRNISINDFYERT